MGIVLNVILFSFKLFAGLVTRSISVMADALNNLTDAGSSVITLIGFRMAGQKPDKDHPFGHGRIEYISGLIVSVIIIIVGFELAETSIGKIFNPETSAFSITTVIILICAVAVKAYMAFYNFSTGKKISSASMRATGYDSLSDCVATSAVLVCLIISHLTSINLDAYCGLAVSGFVLFSGIRAAKETIDPLLGTPPDKEYISQITEIVRSYGKDRILGMHDLIVHDYGPGRTMISLHVEILEDSDLIAMHDMIDNIERKLSETLGCDAVIHMDPISVHDDETSQVRKQIAELVKQIDTRLTVHDLRMVKGPTHTNLIFDLVVPFDMQKSEDSIKETIVKEVKKINENYYTVINIDNSYV